MVAMVATIIVIPQVAGAAANPPGKAIIQNPLGDVSDVSQLIQRVITWMLGMVGILALLAFIWGGGLYLLGFVDEANVKKGKQVITWAVVGLIVVLAASAILFTIRELLL